QDVSDVARCSNRLAQNVNAPLSTNELFAAAIVNGRLDLLPNGSTDFRRCLINMGPAWAHACVEVLFNNWKLEMTLPASDPHCPFGDQRIFFPD
ncbi:MAG: hypothetical protein ACK8QZ_10630, partial [Anaerolineales bacterium]